jgi:opacity protein-like surface antigen
MVKIVVAVALAICLSGAAAAASPPNIMFILADDLGYNELNFMNSSRGIM